MTVININDIKLGPSTKAAHQLYLKAYHYTSNAYNKIKKKKFIIFKTNKYEQGDYSRLELFFSQLALLFLGKNYTASQHFVVDNEGMILGLASEHMHDVIAKKEGFVQRFYILKNELGVSHFTAKKVVKAEEIPIYFFNQLPPGFFAQLIADHKKGILRIDYSSLASILTGSYTLEEDDLHKGNFGFYLVEEQGKPKAVFFKIDHDLMFANTIMSFYRIRPQQVFYNEHTFDVHAEDLLNFPNLYYSSNNYWPTKLSVLSNPWSDRAYHHLDELCAFAHLADIHEFNKAKWLCFYKHILIPSELNEMLLVHCLNKHTAEGRAHIALIMQAITARQASLRAVLFSLKEFRQFIENLSIKETEDLLKEIMDFYPKSNYLSCHPEWYEGSPEFKHSTLLGDLSSQATQDDVRAVTPKQEKKKIQSQLKSSLAFHKSLCTQSVFTEGDTPLHTAIKLGDFRYEETLGNYAHLINVNNKEGKTALDCALDLFLKKERFSDSPFELTEGCGEPRRVDCSLLELILTASEESKEDILYNLPLIMKYLLQYGAKESDYFKSFNKSKLIEHYQYQNPYILRAKQIKNYEELKELLRDLGEETHYCLKFKKKITVECVKQLIKSQPNSAYLNKLLIQLRKDINEQVPELKYIRQLRSNLWIIRQIRGLYGWTTTQGELNNVINLALANQQSYASSCSFFSNEPIDRSSSTGFTNKSQSLS